MPRDRNFLIGYGERLAEQQDRVQSGGEKNPPYTFHAAIKRTQERLSEANRYLQALPADACPGDEAVASLTMHPRYISNSDAPIDLFREVGLRPIGSKPLRIKPERWGIQKPPKGTALAEQIFVAGTREAFRRWEKRLPRWTAEHRGAEDLQHLESLAAFTAADKTKGLREATDGQRVTLEIVLHSDSSHDVLAAFAKYARRFRAEVLLERARPVGRLLFLPIRARVDTVAELARFSFLRVARSMPELRPITAILRASRRRVKLPEEGPLDPTVRVAVFDGGLPSGLDLSPWVKLYEPDGLGPAVPAFQEHGAAVTSALLFGPLDSSASRPYAFVDHYRVLDRASGRNADLEILDVLDRILAVLDRKPAPYEFVNLSLGPRLPIEDDDITRWTAELDQRLAGGAVLLAVAAGNDGKRDSAARLNRIQPPSDGVNVLSVGACDSAEQRGWSRAEYSSVGPGRNPGLMKPDGVAFGGCESDPFRVLVHSNDEVIGTSGTSFASPLALRTALGVRSRLGDVFTPLALRALLIHRTERDSHPMSEVGWGRFEHDVDRLVTCEDHEFVLVYRGHLPKGYYLRAPVPLPRSVKGRVTVTATVLIAPQVSPENADAYTRGGLDIVWRPNAERFNLRKDGTKTKHAASKSFFSMKSVFGQGEYKLREDGKWEPCRKAQIRVQATSLSSPAFDLYHHSRHEQDEIPVPYAMILGVSAPKVRDLYSQIVRTYSNVLVPLRPRTRVHVRT